MKGGDMSDYLPVSAEEFKNTGYARAKEAINSYPLATWPTEFVYAGTQLNTYTIQQAYFTYYNQNGIKDKKVPKYTYKKVPLIGSYLYSKKGEETTPILTPKEFSEVLSFVVASKGETKFAPVQRIRNDRFANFTESLDTFIRSTDSLKTMKKLTAAEIVADAAEIVADAANKAQSSARNAVVSAAQPQMSHADAEKASAQILATVKGNPLANFVLKGFTGGPK
jgi:crotonobetainyl-CoA:carnitine CoA-transferase CaiB-like acyl-CoA transferase